MQAINSINSRAPTFHGTDAAYLLPNDSVEHLRLQSQHAALVDLTEKRIIHAPVTSPSIILDIGCGTGVVTRHIADVFPQATHVYGIDLSPVPSAPSDLKERPSLSFIQGDIHKLILEDPRLRPNSADLVFNRLLICGITDWPQYMKTVLKLLKPGAWVEMQDFCENIIYADSRIVPHDKWEWLKMIRQAQADKGLDPDAGANLRRHMVDAGFVDVSEKEFKVPFSRKTSAASIAEHYIGDPWGHHWRLIQKLGREQGLDEDHISRLQEEMKEGVKEEEGKAQLYFVTIGRKPE